ncbi:MAG: ribonuclease P protein component [Pseudomonadota bacterium]
MVEPLFARGAPKAANASLQPELSHARAQAGGDQFGRERRLRKPVEFQRVLKGGTRVGGRYFRFVARVGESPDGRLGLAIAKRSLKRAVDRNLAKRTLRESYRQQSHDTVAQLDIVVMANPSVRGAPPAALRAELDRQWIKVRRKCVGSSP